MRKLRGEEKLEPRKDVPRVSPAVDRREDEDLKILVKTLGHKLKETNQQLQKKSELLASEERHRQTLLKKVESLQSSLSLKDDEIQRSKHDKQLSLSKCGKLEQEMVQLKAHASSCTPPEELSKIQRELLSYREKESKWKQEREKLEQSVEREKQRGRSDASSTNNQLIRLSMSCRQLEEEVHALKCEKAATLRQLTQLKSQLETTEKKLKEEQIKVEEFSTSSSTDIQKIQELSLTCVNHESTIKELSEKLETVSASLLSANEQIAHIEESLANEQLQVKTLSVSSEEAQRVAEEMKQKYDEAHAAREKAEETARYSKEDKETADIRVKEVEEHLIIKLQSITELEEALNETSSRAEELEYRISSSEKELDKSSKELKKAIEARDAALADALSFEQKLSKAEHEITSLKKRIAAFEHLQQSALEASAHASAISQLFTPPRKSSPAPQIEEEFTVLSSAPAEPSKSSLEQHELF